MHPRVAGKHGSQLISHHAVSRLAEEQLLLFVWLQASQTDLSVRFCQHRLT